MSERNRERDICSSEGKIRLPSFRDFRENPGRSLLEPFMYQGRSQPSIEYAFLVHPRDAYDALACARISGLNFSLLARLLPRRLEQEIKNRYLYQSLARIPPFFIGDGLITTGNSEVKGNLIAVLLYGEQMLSNDWRTFAKERIIEAIGMTKERGAKIIGLGAHTSPATLGGKLLVGQEGNNHSRRKEVEGVGITNGNALTAVMSVESVRMAADNLELSSYEATVGVVGASGSVGSAASRLLVEEGFKVILNGRLMPKLRSRFSGISGLSNVILSDKLEDMKQCDIILVVTSSTQSTIQPKHISPGTIIVEDTQPRNISKQMGEVIRRRGSLVVDGGFVHVPGYYCGFNLRLPKEVTFACLAETLILAKEKRYGDYSIGDPKPEQAKEMMELARRHNITVAPFTWNSRPVSNSEFDSVKAENRRVRRQPSYSLAS